MEHSDERPMETAEVHGDTIIAGMGRFGQMVNILLVNCGYRPTVMDLDVDAVEGFTKLGFKTYFGDASRPELLAAAGIDDAKLFVIAIDDQEKSLQLVHHIRHVNPDMPIVARAYDWRHCYDLYQAGGEKTHIIRETFDSSIRAGQNALQLLGFSEEKAQEISRFFYHRDRNGVFHMAELYDPELPRFGNQAMMDFAIQFNEETKQMIQKLLQAE